MATIEQVTGDRPLGCPHRAFADPFVRRCYEGLDAYEKGCFDAFFPNASNRHIDGVSHLSNVLGRISAHFDDKDREKREAEHAAFMAKMKARSGRG